MLLSYFGDHGVSKAWLRFTALSDWLAKLVPLSKQMRSKTKNRARLSTRFPALGAGYMYLLRILIGSLRYLCRL